MRPNRSRPERPLASAPHFPLDRHPRQTPWLCKTPLNVDAALHSRIGDSAAPLVLHQAWTEKPPNLGSSHAPPAALLPSVSGRLGPSEARRRPPWLHCFSLQHLPHLSEECDPNRNNCICSQPRCQAPSRLIARMQQETPDHPDQRLKPSDPSAALAATVLGLLAPLEVKKLALALAFEEKAWAHRSHASWHQLPQTAPFPLRCPTSTVWRRANRRSWGISALRLEQSC
mmetsp:Transcript_31841/g.68591  ORF Transcript_31841/g.68591 Transcript_31841/m.68591 type:complete len:229 (+) Transcript_31841:256-942(+)